MKITIIDGSPNTDSYSNFLIDLGSDLIEEGHKVKLFKTSAMKINYCLGCWSCWWKTPGECPQVDDMPQIYKSYLKSDLVIHYSPIIAGFISSKLKTVNDRSVPLVHPYIKLVDKECHHKARYDHYPKMALIVDPANADQEELDITHDLYRRMAINLKSELKLFTTTQKPVEEIIDEINHI